MFAEASRVQAMYIYDCFCEMDFVAIISVRRLWRHAISVKIPFNRGRCNNILRARRRFSATGLRHKS